MPSTGETNVGELFNTTLPLPVEEVTPVPEKQAPKEEVAVTTTKAAAPVEVKKVITKSISCVKGKVTRKISGTNPKCPAGFKKK